MYWRLREASDHAGRWCGKFQSAIAKMQKGHADAVSGVNAALPTRRPTQEIGSASAAGVHHIVTTSLVGRSLWCRPDGYLYFYRRLGHDPAAAAKAFAESVAPANSTTRSITSAPRRNRSGFDGIGAMQEVLRARGHQGC